MFNRFLFIILHIFPSLIISYPVSGRVYQSSDHSVLLIGDFHQKEGNPKEIEFKETAAPFIKRLVEDNNIDCVVECTESYLRKKSQHLEKCQSVDDIKKFISTMPLILHLGFLKQNILEDFIWKKFNFGQELQNYFQIKI